MAEAQGVAAFEESRQGKAERIIKRQMWISAGIGALPFPILDGVAVTSVQLWMVRDLCRLYNVPFSREWAKESILSLVGGFAPSALKAIPGVGAIAGALTGPALSAGSTYALGKVFIQHFESGGTLLTFDPRGMRSYFKGYYQEGQRQAAEPQRQTPATEHSSF